MEPIKIKLSYILIFVLVIILIFLSFYFKEPYKNLAPLPDLKPFTEAEFEAIHPPQKHGFNGNPFFERTTLKDTNKVNIKPYGGYKIPTIEGEFIPENLTEDVLQEQQVVSSKMQDFFNQFIGKNIGKIDVTNNDYFNSKGTYGNNSNLSNFKEITGQDNFPGVVSSKISNVSSNGNSLSNPTISRDNKPLDDNGFISFLNKTFINYLNTNTKFNFIADNIGKTEIVTNKDNSKEFTIPFFIYESIANYTRGIIINYTLIPIGTKFNQPIYNIIISNIKETHMKFGKLKLEPAELHGSYTSNDGDSKNIIDTNGYYTIYNYLGLMFPFNTSPNTFTDGSGGITGIDEGPIVLQEQIDKHHYSILQEQSIFNSTHN
jgi:hypothetical protein